MYIKDTNNWLGTLESKHKKTIDSLLVRQQSTGSLYLFHYPNAIPFCELLFVLEKNWIRFVRKDLYF